MTQIKYEDMFAAPGKTEFNFSALPETPNTRQKSFNS